MRRIFATAFLLAIVPAASFAEGTMPQMDFHNQLTLSQIIWMVVILAGLYFTLAGWGLPAMGKVLANRAAVIAADLNAARTAKMAADAKVKDLNAALAKARATSAAEIAAAVAGAKAEAAAQAAALSAQLNEKLSAAEAEIEATRTKALAAIQPVAEDAAQTILAKLTGVAPDRDALSAQVIAALETLKAA